MAALAPAAPVVFGFRDFLKVGFLGFLLALTQGVLAAWSGLAGFGPEWMLVLTVYVTLRTDLWAAVSAAFVLGIFRDAVGGGLWGLHPFTLALIAWLFHPYRSRLNFFSPLTLTPLILILGLVGNLFILTPVMAILGWPGRNFNPLPSFLISSMVTAVTAPLIFYLLRRLSGYRESQ